MEIISMIMSGLALLAVAAITAVVVAEKKRSQKRNAAVAELTCRVEELVLRKTKELDEKVKRLEEGVVPDYESARRAADAVNDFNKGISSILGFDPHEAWQKEKQKEHMGGDVG